MSKYQESLERCQKAVNLEQPDRIPVICKVDPTFAIEYAGFDMKEALWNVDRIAEAYSRVYEDFYFDGGGYMGRFPLFYKVMQSKSFVPNDSNGYVQHPEVSGLEAEEYDEYIADPYKTIVNKVVPRLYPALAAEGMEGGLNWARAINANNRIMGKIVAGNTGFQTCGAVSPKRPLTLWQTSCAASAARLWISAGIPSRFARRLRFQHRSWLSLPV